MKSSVRAAAGADQDLGGQRGEDRAAERDELRVKPDDIFMRAEDQRESGNEKTDDRGPEKFESGARLPRRCSDIGSGLTAGCFAVFVH